LTSWAIVPGVLLDVKRKKAATPKIVTKNVEKTKIKSRESCVLDGPELDNK